MGNGRWAETKGKQGKHGKNGLVYDPRLEIYQLSCAAEVKSDLGGYTAEKVRKYKVSGTSNCHHHVLYRLLRNQTNLSASAVANITHIRYLSILGRSCGGRAELSRCAKGAWCGANLKEK